VAAPARRLKHAARAVGWVLLALYLAIGLFLLAAWIGSSIPRNQAWREPEQGVGIMVGTNGIHTELVLPLVTAEKDWRPTFPAADLSLPGRDYTHVAVSWGEREVFLETPTWWDLKPTTALRVIGIGGDGLIHASHYVRPAPSDEMRPLRLTSAEYSRLVAAIEAVLPQGQRVRHDGYGPQDVFYDAPGSYTVDNTCNQWTGNMLAAAGVRMGWWTPFAGGVMKWIPSPDA
jgi:uncharacterized protein (TIGR02117 family)